MSSKYLFVVDTDSCSGNFERELCAFVTGQYGQCGVGQETAERVPESVREMFEEIVTQEMDDNGCSRPACIYPTPGFYNDGLGEHLPGDANEPGRYPAYQSVGIWLERIPTEAEAQVLVSRAKELCLRAAELVMFRSDPIICSGCRLVEVVTTEAEIAVYTA